MKFGKSYWLIIFTTLFLVALLVNQVIYVYKAASEQEKAFNDKVNVVLDVIEDKISENSDFCKSVKTCMFKNKQKHCSKSLRSKKDWQLVDAIIQDVLRKFNIDLHYNFDFCNSYYMNGLKNKGKETYSKNMDKVFQKAGVIMFIEFPGKSKYIFLQIGSVFFSSILFIILITILFVITFKYYKRERMIAETIKDFLNNMMHEFKTPLTNISFANSMITKHLSGGKQDKITKYTEIIRSENERIIMNCNDILEYSKQERSLQNSFDKTVDIHKIIKEIQKSFLSSNTQKITITLQLEADAFLVKGRDSFLYNVFSNIIDNAIKYCETNPEILIHTKNDNKKILISIKDNGIGIHKSKLNLVFDKFYRIKNGDVHNVKGFGLGLSYVKLIIEQMKGEVVVKSEPGRGSVFIVKLPITND